MNKRQEQKLKTKAHIIETSIQEFARGGFINTRTSDIAKSAEISHGTVFSHFPSRDILIEETIEEFGRRLGKSLHKLVENNCGIREILKAHIMGIKEYEDFYIRLISEMPLIHESGKNTVIAIQSMISLHFLYAAEKEIEDSKIISMPMNLMFNTWIGILNYYLMNRDLFAPGESIVEVYGDVLIDHYMNLISLK